MRAIVDTNVAVTANGRSAQASLPCVRACVQRLLTLRENGKIVLDTSWHVLREYKDNLSETGQPGVGDAFLLWVLQNWANPLLSELYSLDYDPQDRENFVVFPRDPELAQFDPSDRKFVALAIVSDAPILNAVDSDWHNSDHILRRFGVYVDFICPEYFHR